MCTNGVEQSLEDILKSREERVLFQKYLLEKFKGNILSYKLNIPGPIKYNSLIKDIFDEGLKEIKHTINKKGIKVIYERTFYKESGPEHFISFYDSPCKVKKLSTSIEETHPLGRLFDIDIIDENGIQISRQDMDKRYRSCLICDNSAFECARSRKHDLKELLLEIEKMAHDYFEQKNL